MKLLWITFVIVCSLVVLSVSYKVYQLDMQAKGQEVNVVDSLSTVFDDLSNPKTSTIEEEETDKGEIITFYDKSGQVLGYMQSNRAKSSVTDRGGRLLGYVEDNKTTNASGQVLANSKLPGLLFCGH